MFFAFVLFLYYLFVQVADPMEKQNDISSSSSEEELESEDLLLKKLSMQGILFLFKTNNHLITNLNAFARLVGSGVSPPFHGGLVVPHWGSFMISSIIIIIIIIMGNEHKKNYFYYYYC